MEDKDNKPPKSNKQKSKNALFWDLFFTGGVFSFEKEWKKSKSPLHTFLLFFVPILGAGVIVLLAVIASKLIE